MELNDLIKKEEEIHKLVEKLSDLENNRQPIYDGIFDIEQYLKAKYKILFILKEPYDEKNGKGGGWAIKDVLPKGGYGKASKTFYPLIYIANGILTGFKSFDEIPDFIKDNFEEMNNYLYQVAYINISKLPSLNTTRTDFSHIVKAYNNDKMNDNIILKQIDTYQPDIIVSCGIDRLLFADLELYLDDKLNTFKSKKYPNLVYIGTYHPAQISIPQKKYIDHVILTAKKWAEQENKFQ